MGKAVYADGSLWSWLRVDRRGNSTVVASRRIAATEFQARKAKLMDRRGVLAIGAAGLFSCICSRRRGMAATLQGCRTAAQIGDSKWRVLGSTNNARVDELFYYFGNVIRQDFEVNPGLGFYDDTGAPNAVALPEVLVSGGIDGTILMGLNLYTQDMERYYGAKQLAPTLQTAFNCNVIMAHEFGHIMQYKAGMNPEGPWQM
jgi:hypothetical protein